MIELNDTMRERMAAGLSFLYTTRDGHVWYIDATLNFPFRQADFAECMYDAYDGTYFQLHYPSLSMCQYALEEGCPEWRGEGWYWMGGVPPTPTWYRELDNLRQDVALLHERFAKYGEPYMANYGGDGDEAVFLY